MEGAISKTRSSELYSSGEPRFSFVMIVLNGMPFIEYSLKSIYDFAHEIIIIEGAVEKCMFAADTDGSSIDGTVEFIKSFPDIQNKIKFIQGKWPEKCEMQNEALKHVTGNYVWLIDSDEIYKREDLEKIKEILKSNPSITQVNFIPDQFWKGLDYIFVSNEFFKEWCHFRRLFKYTPGATFTSHRPPTMIWPGSDKTTEQMHLLDGTTTRKIGIILYHYSYVLDKQVRQKIELYHRYGWGKDWNIDLSEWYNECFRKWTPANRQDIDSKYPIWTGDINSQTFPFEGTHPRVMTEYIIKMSVINRNTSTPQLVMQHVINTVYETKQQFKNENILAIETGTIRSFNENHLSTFFISRTLGDSGRLISVDISETSIRRSGNICYDTTNVEWVHSDSIQYLSKSKDHKFHFVFLDSVNDKDVIFEEFRLVVPMMVQDAILMVDDAGITKDGQKIDESVPAQKGHKVWQFLRECGIQPLILDTPGGHGTQLKVVMSRENLAKIINNLDRFGTHTQDSNPTLEIPENRERIETQYQTQADDNSSHAKLLNDTKYEIKNVNENQIEQAQALMEQGHIIKALKHFEEILYQKSCDVDAHLGRAICLARLGRLLEAEIESKNALSKESNNSNLLQFTEQIHRLKPNLTGDRDIEWGSIIEQIEEITKIQEPGAKVLDFGCGEAALLSQVASKYGYQITAIDLTPLKVSLDSTQNIHFIQGDFLSQDWKPHSYDLIINCSSIEHSGLTGRFGVVKDGPDDDLKIMAQMSRLIKPEGKMLLTIPVGLDKTVGSLHRIYGQNRLTQLLNGWKVESSCFWIKDENNQWRQVDEESALQREPMLAYGLGCFVLCPTVRAAAPTDNILIPTNSYNTETLNCSEDNKNANIVGSTKAVPAITKQQHKVLIVRTDGIGDFVIFSGSLHYYRELYPNSHITVIVRESVKELAETCPYIDEIIVIQIEPMVYDQNYQIEFIRGIQVTKFDVAICPIYSRDKVSDFITANSGANEKIVSAGNYSNMSPEQIQTNNPYFTQVVPARADMIQETERNMEFLKGLGIKIDQPYKTTLWAEQKDKDFVDKMLKELNIENPIVLCPFAQHQMRDWPTHKWIQLISNYKNYPILICGSQQNSQMAEYMIKATEHPIVHNLCGKTSIRQLAALLAKARLCIGVESGPVHIAAAVDCPQVVLIGGGHFGRFMPYNSNTTLVYNQMACYGCNWQCKYGQDTRCIQSITVDMAEQAVNLWVKKASVPYTQNQKDKYEHTEKEQYLVSAIISTYNSECFIRGCLEDLENQTIADKLEIIVVNSGSQQNEEAIVREFQSRYDNIKYIRTEERETIYSAWNKAIKIAAGKYITNTNTDDRRNKDAIEKMVKALEEHPDKVLVYANYMLVKETNGQMIPVKRNIAGEFSRSRLFDGECPPAFQPMWRKNVHNIFGYFDEGFFISGDYEFWFRLTQKFDFLYLNETLGQCRVSTEAVSQNNDNLMNWENEMVIRKCYEYALKEGLTIGPTGISEHPIFSQLPEVNIWKQNTKAKLENRQISLHDNIKAKWDTRTNASPKLTIVIVTYNRHEELLENLYALNEQTEKKFEVIVVDNGGNLSWLKQHTNEFKFDILGIELEHNFGPSTARNIGTEFAKAEYIAFLDDDAAADKNLVRNILNHFENHNISGLRGKVLTKNQTDPKDIPINYNLGDRVITTACEVSCFSAFKQDALTKTGGFDEFLFGPEGMELSYRICKAQGERMQNIQYFPDVIVYHNPQSKGPAINEKILRQKYMGLLAWRKDNNIISYIQHIYTESLNNQDLITTNEQKTHVLNMLKTSDRTSSLPTAAKNKTTVSTRLDDSYLVSAIISTYNSEKFLRGCFEDLENQTIADKLEIIIVNSGSQQNEETIIKEFQQRYNNIKYIKTDQREGIYSAWNRAVKVAQGTFLTNANTDDRHRHDALEIMAQTLQANPDIALVYGDQICTDTLNGTFDNHHAIKMAKRPEYSFERLLFGCCVGSQPMWRKSLHNEFGYFDDTLTCAGDWDFWLRISRKNKLKHIPEFLGLYYNNEDGIEHSRKIHSLYERYAVGNRYGNPYISVIPLYHNINNPLISIITPAYNAAEYIAETIESVLIQNYRNFELIIVDDGSTDNTRDIVTSFKDDKIKYFYKENSGPSDARNLALKKSSGQYIIPLDSDDMITPDFIAKHLQEFEMHPEADLVYCNDYLIDENSKPIRIIKRPEYTNRKTLIRDLFRSGFPLVPFRTCFRRSVLDKIGLFDEDLLVGEDYDMIRRFVKHGLKMHHLQDTLYLRRITNTSLSNSYSIHKAKCHFEVIKRFTDTFKYDELFPDVAWDQISPQIRHLHSKCLTAGTYLAIGQDYVKSKALEYSKIAFDLACSELNDCIKMDPENRDLQQLFKKSQIIRARYNGAPQQVVC